LSESDGPQQDYAQSLFARFGATVLRLLRFFSRLPVPAFKFERTPHGMPDPDLAPLAMPIAALIIVLPMLLTLGIADLAGAPASVAAGLALAALALTTGGLHEDGLADMIDGFSGSHTKDKALEIMRDSRIGAHGALALILSVGLQWTALAAILSEAGLVAALIALAAAAIFSRGLALAPLALLPPARTDGRGLGFGKPRLAFFVIGLVIGIDITLATAASMLTLFGAGIGIILALGACRLIISAADRRLGGHTGDICGACQQAGQCALLLGFSLI
jgi:adenosylcobinamide-GDP ribazoletransferase